METKVSTGGFWDRFFKSDLEHDRFGVISIALLLVGCLGGLTVGFGAIHHTWQLFLIVIPTMTTLSMILAVAPVNWILNMTLISTIINLLILNINLV